MSQYWVRLAGGRCRSSWINSSLPACEIATPERYFIYVLWNMLTRAYCGWVARGGLVLVSGMFMVLSESHWSRGERRRGGRGSRLAKLRTRSWVARVRELRAGIKRNVWATSEGTETREAWRRASSWGLQGKRRMYQLRGWAGALHTPGAD